MRHFVFAAIAASLLGIGSATVRAAEPALSIAVFHADVTPPLGSSLCNGNVTPAKKIVDPLTARGVILLTDRKPIILCAVDWVGIGNDANRAWRDALAEAAGTTPERVAVHTVHQHDTPGCDFSVEELLVPVGLSGAMCNVPFARKAIARTAAAVREAIHRPKGVTHIGLGKAVVDRVASTRRVLGPDGKVKHKRMSTCKNDKARAAPVGLIDPYLRLVSFWDGDRPLAAVMYYAVHPVCNYRRGAVSSDFAGWARMLREATLPEVAHVYFNGAGGDLAVGKYNDGAVCRRFELAMRLADGMARAWDAVEKHPVAAGDVNWKVLPINLPLRPGWTEERFLQILNDPDAKRRDRVRSARDLTWVRRCKRGDKIDLTCLQIGKASILHLPGEPFVAYQLAAQKMRPDRFVCTAGYGDYGPGYICTAIAYEQDGYEDGRVSRVGPEVEQVLKDALRRLLE